MEPKLFGHCWPAGPSSTLPLLYPTVYVGVVERVGIPGSYFREVDGKAVWVNYEIPVARYPVLGVDTLFAPAHWVDRRFVRPEYWESRVTDESGTI